MKYLAKSTLLSEQAQKNKKVAKIMFTIKISRWKKGIVGISLEDSAGKIIVDKNHMIKCRKTIGCDLDTRKT
jgi:hypothetical protein